MQGYYDHYPTTVLQRPLVLIGFLGTQAAQTAQALCALTGLPLEDVERAVEGSAGRSISHLWLRAGEAMVRRQEAAALRRALTRRPHAVIAAGDGALLDPDVRAAVLAQARVVHLDAPITELARRVRRQLDEKPGSLPQFMQKGAVVTALGLQDLLDARAPGYAEADHRIDISGLRPTQVARRLITDLDLLGVIPIPEGG